MVVLYFIQILIPIITFIYVQICVEKMEEILKIKTLTRFLFFIIGIFLLVSILLAFVLIILFNIGKESFDIALFEISSAIYYFILYCLLRCNLI